MVFSQGTKKRSNSSVMSKMPFAKFLGPVACLGAVAAGMIMAATGNLELSSFEMLRGAGSEGTGGNRASDVTPVKLHLSRKSQTNIRIATFKIQNFDEQKSADANVMRVLTHIISQFDIVAVQGVRGGGAKPVQNLVDSLRASGASYAATTSHPVGDSSHLESYAYIWDDTRIQLVPNSAYLVQDTSDRMRWEPMVASFETRVGTADGRLPFRFTLVNAHASPASAAESAIQSETNVLDDVYVRVRQYDYQMHGEEDCILLGDLNVETSGLSELGQIPWVRSITGNTKTNTLGTEALDHILLDGTITREFSGRFGVLRLVDDLGLTIDQALQVSDHQPLWAEFNIYEMPNLDPSAGSFDQR